MVAAALSAGGNMLDWLLRIFYGHSKDQLQVMIREAAGVPVGSGGLLALPYLDGERAPFRDGRPTA